MKKKGFTLIELLAVIVILSILALILVPIISNVIDSAKKAAFKETVNGIIESVDNYVGEYVLNHHDDLVYPVELYCNGSTCEDLNGEALEFKGKVPISGKVILDSSSIIRADLISDGVYCGSGTKGNVEVFSNCSELDHTSPIIDESKLSDIVILTTTNKLTLSIPLDLMYDEETNITGYDIDLYLGNNKVSSMQYTEPNITFSGLLSNTEYKIVIIGINGNKGKTSIDRYATTLDMTKPTITYTNNPSESVNGYFKNQTLNVSYTKGNVENPEYYVKSSRVASTNINVIGICGSSTQPIECNNIDTNNIDANTWYKVGGNINVLYNNDANTESSLTALIYDGVNYASSDTKVVAKIENSMPTAPIITGGSSNWTNTNRTISVSTAGTSYAGVAKYQYYISTSSNSEVGGSWADVSGTNQNISEEGEHYIFFRTISNAGNISGVSNGELVKVDTTGPTTPTSGAIGNVSGSNTTGTIATAASGSTDSGVGGITYKYMVTNSNSVPSNTNENFKTAMTFTRSCGTSYYGWAIAEDALGNRSAVESLGTTSDGANSYSGWSGCSQKCGATGTKTRTNTCALVTTDLSTSCTVGTTYKDTNGKWGTCSKTCGTGTQSYTVTRTYYSNQDNSVCSTANNVVTSTRNCNTQSCDSVIMSTPYKAEYGCIGMWEENGDCGCWQWASTTNMAKTYTINTNAFSKVVIQVSDVSFGSSSCGADCAWAGRCNSQFGVYIGSAFQPIQEWSYDSDQRPTKDGYAGYLSSTATGGTVTINLSSLGMLNKGNQTLKFGFEGHGGGHEGNVYGTATINRITFTN